MVTFIWGCNSRHRDGCDDSQSLEYWISAISSSKSEIKQSPTACMEQGKVQPIIDFHPSLPNYCGNLPGRKREANWGDRKD